VAGFAAREAVLGPHPEAPKAFRKRPNPRGMSLATLPGQATGGWVALAAATKDL
jgi:hypothetical protein